MMVNVEVRVRKWRTKWLVMMMLKLYMQPCESGSGNPFWAQYSDRERKRTRLDAGDAMLQHTRKGCGSPLLPDVPIVTWLTLLTQLTIRAPAHHIFRFRWTALGARGVGVAGLSMPRHRIVRRA